MRQTVQLPSTTRMKDTRIVRGKDGVSRFALWKSDPSFTDPANQTPYMVREADVGRLDFLAYLMYGDVNLDWVIATANNFVNPISDMKAGMVIAIPTQATVNAYLRRAAYAG